ncbi:hypothetical protein HY641_02410 [Candidatus Woesearchaeota archaeon]|nr:hypothetical protein [Candidatus Woesearchaeota archaeon]
MKMGFDLIALKPKSEEYRRFINNVWGWRPLWAFVTKVCSDLLTEEQINGGHINDGVLINEELALGIARRLKKIIESGFAEHQAGSFQDRKDKVGMITCNACDGTLIHKYTGEPCMICRGTGKVKPMVTAYHFSIENLKEFVKFCENSGGFEIW